MISLIMAAVIGALLFFCAFLGFRQGLRLGMQAGKGQLPPKPVRSSKAKTSKTPEAQLMDGYHNMMAFTGEPKKN